jgi:hypothetical protein
MRAKGCSYEETRTCNGSDEVTSSSEALATIDFDSWSFVSVVFMVPEDWLVVGSE